MNNSRRQLILAIVRDGCREDPSIVSEIIDAATQGVKEYADDQSDRASKLSFVLIDILEENQPVLNFGHFTKEQVFEHVSPYFEGTPGIKKLREKYGLDKLE